MKVLFRYGCSILMTIATACATPPTKDEAMIRISYPQPLPDSVPLAFLPGIVSTDSLDFNAAFSPDGKSFYFARSIQKRSRLFVTHHTDSCWTEAEPVAFTASTYAEADPAFAPDGNLYFISNRPKDQSDTIHDYDIWFVSPLADGSWSAPQNLEAVNTDSAEYYVSFSKGGNLYFASSREGGFGEEDIYLSRWDGRRYTTPQNLGAAINTEKSEYDPCISGNEDLIIFTSSNRVDSFGAGDLYYARRNNNAWRLAVNLGKNFNTPTREYCPYFSPDTTFFFFTSKNDIKWVSVKSLKAGIQ